MTHLPLQKEIETTKILKKSISANRALARLTASLRSFQQCDPHQLFGTSRGKRQL
jgi:hypothetical protein